jgi:hypothetical protein
MPRQFSPGMVSKQADPWLYNCLRAIMAGQEQASTSIAAVARGEVPDGSGAPIAPDLTGYFFLAGRTGGQTGYGGREAADRLVLSSTANASKGFIYLGSSRLFVALDEAQTLVGINKAAPASTLHIVGSTSGLGSTLISTSVITAGWGDERSGSGGSGTGNDSLHALISNDDLTSYIAINAGAPVGINPHKMGLGGTITPGGTYQIMARFAPFSANSDITKCAWMVSVVDSAGNQWDSAATFNASIAPFTAAELSTTALVWANVTRSITCSGTPVSTGNTPNAVWLWCDMIRTDNIPLYGLVSYVEVAQTGSSLLRWDLSGGTRSGQIDVYGRMGIGTGSTDVGAQLDVVADAATTLGLRVKAAASATANLVKLINSAGTDLAGHTAAGAPYLIAGAALDALLVSDASGVGAWKSLVASGDEMLFYEDSPVFY